MPGQGSYGSAGKWIHDRAHRIMEKGDITDKHGEKGGKSIAYAIATQQAHKMGKSPKKHRTAEGMSVAKQKYTLPRKEYRKTASVDPYKGYAADEKRRLILGSRIGGALGAGAGLLAGVKSRDALTGLAYTLGGLGVGTGAGFLSGMGANKMMSKKAAAFFDEFQKISASALLPLALLSRAHKADLRDKEHQERLRALQTGYPVSWVSLGMRPE